MVYDSGGTLLGEIPMPLAQARAIAELADTEQIAITMTIAGRNYYRADLEPAERKRLYGTPVDRHLDALTSAPTRLLIYGEQAAGIIYEQFSGAPLRMVRHYRDGRLNDVVITAREATKERALAMLCERVGLSLGGVLAIGDAEADLEMLRAAGVGVAVGNAVSEVLSAADWIAPPCDQAGVAAAVRRYVLE